MKLKALLSLYLVAFLLTGYDSLAAKLDKTYQLTFQPKAQDSYLFTQKLKSTSTSGKKHMHASDMEIDYKVDIAGIDSLNGTIINFSVQRLAIKTKVDQDHFEFSSDKTYDHNFPIQQAYAKLIGKTFTLVYSPTQGVSSTNYFESFFSEFKNIDEAATKQMVQAMQDLFGDEALKNTFKQFAFTFPLPVAKKQSWVTTDSIAPFKLQSTYTLKSINDTKAVVKQKGMILSDSAVPHDSKGYIKCKYEIDPATGWVLSSHMTQVIKTKSDHPVTSKTVIETKRALAS